MEQPFTRIHYLFDRYTTGSCSDAEKQEYLQLVQQEEYAGQLQALILQQLEQPAPGVVLPEEAADSMLRAITGTPVIGKRRKEKRWLGWAAAAAVLIALAGSWFWLQGSRRQVQPVMLAAQQDIKAGSNKASLTLADGSVVSLDNAGNQLIQQGGATVQQQGGQLQYLAKGNAAAGFNTLTTPRGGQFRVTLPDGTKAWLNAASSLRYPVVFSGKERKVEVTGEAYFEVAPDAQKPFRVAVAGKAAIEVLGTSFNVNSYENEQSISTTLLTGAVKVSRQAALQQSLVLKPGQQARLAQQLELAGSVDIDKVIAWKEGYFNLEGMSVAELMRQLERWYDIQVVYEQQAPAVKLFGKISRDKSLDAFLQAMSYYEIKFRREGNKLIVLPG